MGMVVPFRFRDHKARNSISILAEPINYGGVYSVLTAGYYTKMVNQLNEDDVVLDGGANVGAFSLLISKRVKKIVSLEANPVNYQYLLQNIDRNRLTNVIPINAALTDYKGSIRFEGQGEGGHISSNGLTVQCTTIDDIERDLGISFSALKLDVEGAEPLAIMGGAVKALKHVSKIIYEIDEGQLRNIIQTSPTLTEKIFDYDQLYKYLTELGFKFEVYEPDVIRYSLLKHNVKSGNVRVRDIARNEIVHGLWYTRQTIKGGFFSFTRSRNPEHSRIWMAYATKGA